MNTLGLAWSNGQWTARGSVDPTNTMPELEAITIFLKDRKWVIDKWEWETIDPHDGLPIIGYFANFSNGQNNLCLTVEKDGVYVEPQPFDSEHSDQIILQISDPKFFDQLMETINVRCKG